MLKNYLLVAFRNLRRNKIHGFINIAGLAIGLAVVLLIGLWIFDECTYDRYNPNYHRIARLMQFETTNGITEPSSSLPYPLLADLRTTYAGSFRRIVASWWTRDHVLGYADKKLPQKGKFMEPGAIELMGLRLLQGTQTALDDPQSVALSALAAKTLFAGDDPLGKTVQIDGKLAVTVRAVYADIPDNSIFRDVQFIAPFGLFTRSEPWTNDIRGDWGYDFCEIYVELADNADPTTVSARLRNSTLLHMRNNPEAASYHSQVFVQPMSRWHLFSEYSNGVNSGGAIRYVWLFGTIGLAVLLLACINFMNLSTARSERRAKEVGIRKTLGSLRGQLILQFYTESILVVLLAFLLSLLLTALALPWFNALAGKRIAIPWSSPWLWCTGISFSLLTGLVAGSYPALYLSAFRPVAVLKSRFRAGRGAALPGRVLIVLQFSVSILLVIGTCIVFRQVQYARSRPVGYDRQRLLALPVSIPEFNTHAGQLRQELLQTGQIASTAISSSPTTQIWEGFSGFQWPGKDPAYQGDFGTVSVSYDYGSTIGWHIREGRDFSRDFATDSSGLIVNERAAAVMGLQHPVGTPVKWGDKTYRIIGVVRDMIVESPYEPARQTIYLLNFDFNHQWFFIKPQPGIAMNDALTVIRRVFQHVLPEAAFDYRFVDEQYARKFAVEERMGALAACFAGFALLISALGIFGMAVFMAGQRTREIGIRRVLGATVFSIWEMLTREFVLLTALSLALAAPLAGWGMHRWLQQYTFHTGIAWWIFVLTAAGVIAITLLTVSWTAIRAALSNPVHALRSE